MFKSYDELKHGGYQNREDWHVVRHRVGHRFLRREDERWQVRNNRLDALIRHLQEADRLPGILETSMARYGELTGRSRGLVEPYRLEDAEYALVGMGSLVETAMATADWLRDRRGLRVGVLGVTVFRPFPAREIVAALSGVSAAAVVERMDNPLAAGNPLATEIKAAFADAVAGDGGAIRIPIIHGASAGLGSRDVRPGDLVAAVGEIAKGGRRSFVLGIPHEAAVPRLEDPDVRPPGAFSMRGHSVGGFGSVATNRVIATLLGDLPFDLWVQAYPLYGSEKKGLPTTYYLTVAEERIRTHSELAQVDFVPLNDINAFKLGDPLAGIAAGGTVFVQSAETDPARIWAQLPDAAKSAIRDKGLRLLALDTVKIARETSTNPALRQRMQGVVLLGIFLRATPFLERRKVGVEQAFAAVETSVRKMFGKRSETVVQENLRAARRGYDEVMEVLPL